MLFDVVQYNYRKEVQQMKNFKKSYLKKEGEELQQYLHLRKRGHIKKNGKAYDRKKFKKGED